MSEASESKPAHVSSDGTGPIDRPFRVKLRGSVLVIIRLPNRRELRAALHQLSITGGVIHLGKPLDEKIEVELIFHIQGVTIRGTAQMLFPMWATQGWLQPFRFLALSDSCLKALDASLKVFAGQMTNAAAAGNEGESITAPALDPDAGGPSQ